MKLILVYMKYMFSQQYIDLHIALNLHLSIFYVYFINTTLVVLYKIVAAACRIHIVTGINSTL